MILIALFLAAQTRIASDFEIQQMERQVAHSRDFLSQLSGHLNLGDLRTARNESALARAEYVKARDIAEIERREARRASAMTRYATRAHSGLILRSSNIVPPIFSSNCRRSWSTDGVSSRSRQYGGA